jgi:hypothetical protein
VAVQHLVGQKEFLHYSEGEIVAMVDRIQYHMYILPRETFPVDRIVEEEIGILGS